MNFLAVPMMLTGGVTVADSIESLISIITALVSGATTWIGSAVTMLIGHPLLLGLMLIPMLSIGIGLIRRFFF